MDWGGLGFKNFRRWNKAFLLESLWACYQICRIRWVELMWAKYLPNSKIEYHSPLWKSTINLKEILFDHLCVRIGNGQSASFWFDKWLPSGALASQMVGNSPDPCSHARVSYYMFDGHWNIQRLQRWVPPEFLPEILACLISADLLQIDIVEWRQH